jgi:hypothetical protein
MTMRRLLSVWSASRERRHAVLRLGFVGSLGLLALLAALVATGVVSLWTNPDRAAATPPGLPPEPTPAAAEPPPVERAIALIQESRMKYQEVHDYTCTFIKRENVNGAMQPENIILMKVRTQPFSVYLRWMGPQSLAGQEVCYVAGRNNDMMRVHAVGLRAIAGFVSIAPNDPRAMAENRHTIKDAGIGHLLETLTHYWEIERKLNTTQIQIGEYEYNKRPCVRIEAIHPERNQAFYAGRCVLYLDKITKLPVRFEAYDWARPGGSPGGELLECYSYVNMHTNTGLGEEVFNH